MGDALPEFRDWSRVAVLLMRGVVYNEDDRVWNVLLSNTSTLESYFARLGLRLVVVESDGMAYLRQLKDDGGLAIHVTNRYLDLRPVVAGAAAQLGRTALIVDLDPDEGDRFCRHSVWVLLAQPERAAKLAKAMTKVETLLPRPGFKVWTDDFSNLLNILK